MAEVLSGEIALVTGAGINTGAVIAKTLARPGAALVINYRRAEAAHVRRSPRSKRPAARRLPCRAT
jgi:NAD(P)-dependent dehydrogenase (short-subunit alcohol dehydrogenase family)